MWAFGVCYETPEFFKNLVLADFLWVLQQGGEGSLSFLLGVGGPCPCRGLALSLLGLH